MLKVNQIYYFNTIFWYVILVFFFFRSKIVQSVGNNARPVASQLLREINSQHSQRAMENLLDDQNVRQQVQNIQRTLSQIERLDRFLSQTNDQKQTKKK